MGSVCRLLPVLSNLLSLLSEKRVADEVYVGSQSHLQEGMGYANAQALNYLASANVAEVAITELDIRNAPSSDYVTVIKGCTQLSKCVGVTVWGVSDRVSFHSPLLVRWSGVVGWDVDKWLT
jgi:GH35 family endo-1,4-beta-xylanase